MIWKQLGFIIGIKSELGSRFFYDQWDLKVCHGGGEGGLR